MGWSGDDLAANAEQYGTINRYIGENALDGQADFVLYHAVVDRVFITPREGLSSSGLLDGTKSRPICSTQYYGTLCRFT